MAGRLPLCIHGGLPGGAMPKLDLGKDVGMSWAKRSRERGAEEFLDRENSFFESGTQGGLGRARDSNGHERF